MLRLLIRKDHHEGLNDCVAQFSLLLVELFDSIAFLRNTNCAIRVDCQLGQFVAEDASDGRGLRLSVR